MKLHISYNVDNLKKAIDLAQQTASSASLLGVGSLLLLQCGIKAVATFKEQFPSQPIFAEANIIEKGDLAVKMLAQAGASYISVLAGGTTYTLKKAVETGKEYGVKIFMNMQGAQSFEQVAADAKTIGVDGLIFHLTPFIKDKVGIDAAWQSIRGNTPLPIFVTGNINKEIIHQMIELDPETVMIGSAITDASNPALEARYFHGLIKTI